MVMEIRIEIASALFGPRNDKMGGNDNRCEEGRNVKLGRDSWHFHSEFRIPNSELPIFQARSCIFALVLRPDSPIPLGLKQGNSGINM